MIASCSALNSDHEYVSFKWFWAVEVPFSKYWNQRHLLTSLGTKFYYDRIVFSVKFWSRICLFQMVLSSRSAGIEISATKWQVLELNFIMIASCSALNSDNEYVCFKWFWAVEVRFSKFWNQRHLLTSLGTKFYYDRIVFSVKFWSRICLFQMVLSSRSAFF
jgi:hypothetical protein